MLLPALSKAINAYLKLDDESKHRLQKLHGKSIAIELLPFHFCFQCVFSDNAVTLRQDPLLECDATLRGTPLQMMGVMIDKENRHRFFAEDLKIEGNAEIGQQMVALFDELQIDWEEHLSRFIGDIPAYHAGKFIRGMNEWFARSSESFTQNISEFLHEEINYLPPREALQDFFTDIDTLRMDADRIEARIKHLGQQHEIL